MSVTIDASVFVGAARPQEMDYAASLAFLQVIEQQGENVFCPTLVLAECAAAIARQTDRRDLAERTLAFIESFPNLSVISLDIPLARRSAEIAIVHRLRGADAVYAAVAEAMGATLITWDNEML